MKRSDFMKLMAAGAGSLAPLSTIARPASAGGQAQRSANGLLSVSSGNGLRATERAMEMMRGGSDAIDAVIEGVNIVEEDPDDISVGYGGLPNEDGVVQLDACCMHGPTHNAGSVGALEGIKTPSKVARLVMEQTDHVQLVGKGAQDFAKAHGFTIENLLTDRSRRIWLDYKASLSDDDDWFPPQDEDDSISYQGLEVYGSGSRTRITGTISCMGLDQNGNISGVTTTSGLFFKIPGRVGDSPIIGAGLYVDNEVGACGSTGRGEENLKNLSCFMVVEFMRQGDSPEEACLKVCQRLVDHAKLPNLLNENGRPDFNVNFYALNRDGAYGCASIYGPNSYAVHDGNENVRREGAYLFDED
ncbi:MAG: N(4)-(beta-N-acetylglucosaminyl)-L-asparaginase [Balneolaceae bacterium]|nr:N(4)-(beta-N-acetylglucosaminyl)-L-asparaginase [Balneolaceae bacterium]